LKRYGILYSRNSALRAPTEISFVFKTQLECTIQKPVSRIDIHHDFS
jgi:hypothetical protein